MISGNTAASEGGGIYGQTATDCVILGNVGLGGGGGVSLGILNNCVIAGNVGSPSGFGGGGVTAGTVTGCVIVSNYCNCPSGVDVGTVNNSIVRYNFCSNAPSVEQNYAIYSFSHMNYCCTWPLPSGSAFLSGNITNEPGFVDLAGGDYRLQSNSACINSGGNAYITTADDFNGNPRISGGTVDIGPYEFQVPLSTLSYAWAQQYGLPTDGTADFQDPDGDGMNNWEESIAGTVPTNATSVLKMLLPVTSDSSNRVITWQSVNNRVYYLQRFTNLNSHPAFSTSFSNIAGQQGTTSFADTNPPVLPSAFYRVGIQ